MDSLRKILEGVSVTDAHCTAKERDHNLKEQLGVVENLLQTQPHDLLRHMGGLLTTFRPSRDTIPYLALIQLALEQTNLPPGVTRLFLLDRTLEFLLDFNPYHVRYVGNWFKNLLMYVASGRAFTSLVSVEAVVSALLRLDPTASMFTSIHPRLVRLAYENAHVKSVLPILDRDIIFYPGMTGQKDAKILCEEDLSPSAYISVDTRLTERVTVNEVLEYNIVAGLCYLSVHDWSKAHKAFERVVSHPSKDKGVSEIMVVAYKRWLLTGLLKDGQEPRLPSHTSPSASNAFNVLTIAYQNIVTNFVAGNVTNLVNEMEIHRGLWETDGSLSLVAKVAEAFQRWQIVNLRKVYQQVSIAQIRKTTVSGETGQALQSDEQVLALVQDMLASNMLTGKLQIGDSGEDSYLSFEDDELDASEADFAREVVRRHQSIKALGEHYRAVNERVSLNKDYVKSVIRDQKRMERELSEAAGFDSQVEDEDLMTGIVANT